MKTKVQSNPENIYVASGYKEIGKSLELQRRRITNVVYAVSRENNDAQQARIDALVGTDGITDAEKPSLARELDALIRDFTTLGNETRNADLGDSDEYYAAQQAYDRLFALMTKIVNSVGTYEESDVNLLTEYYADYTEKAITLGNLIIEITAEIERLNAYRQLTEIRVNAIPMSLPVNTNTDIVAEVYYNGEDKTSLVDATNFSFGITGLVSGTAQEMQSKFTLDTTTYPNASVTAYPLTNSAIVVNCKSFKLNYFGIGTTGVVVTCSVTLDSDSMPF